MSQGPWLSQPEGAPERNFPQAQNVTLFVGANGGSNNAVHNVVITHRLKSP